MREQARLWAGMLVMLVVTPLLFWVPIPAVAGFGGGWTGGLAVGSPVRASIAALVPAALFGVLGLTLGLSVAGAMPIIGGVIQPLFVAWVVITCAALVIGAYFGGARERTSIEPHARGWRSIRRRVEARTAGRKRRPPAQRAYTLG